MPNSEDFSCLKMEGLEFVLENEILIMGPF